MYLDSILSFGYTWGNYEGKFSLSLSHSDLWLSDEQE